MAQDTERRGRILSLDGGGVRGLTSLYILKEIMAEVALKAPVDPFADPNSPKVFRPCDYFDIICGTSTGGLIALMLGRMEYVVMSPSIRPLKTDTCRRWMKP
jgi:patatin-like phospholipase/acyl hydrolase